MKNFFQKTVLMLLCCLLLAALPMNAFAAGSVSFSMGSAQGKPGTTVDISVQITSNSGFFAVGLAPALDSSDPNANFKLVSTSSNVAGFTFTDGSWPLWDSVALADQTVTGPFATYHIRISDKAAPGTYRIPIAIDISTLDGAPVGASANEIVITVECDHATKAAIAPKEPTCTEAGNNAYSVCTACGAAFDAAGNATTADAQTVPAKGHTPGGWTQTKAPSCTEVGARAQSCAVCGAELASQEIAMVEHAWDKGEVTTAATCTQEGVKTYTCATCKTTKTQPIEKLPHTPGEWTQTKAPSCTEVGAQVQSCTVCGAELASQEIAMVEHTWDKGQVTKEPTCAAGEKTYTCTVCRAAKTEELNATGKHSWEKSSEDAATCEKAEVERYTCKVCASTEDRTIGGPLGHDEVRATVQALDCEHDGIVDVTCSRCDYTNREVTKTEGHRWKVTGTKPATCTEEGSKTSVCENCKEQREEVIAALGHDWGKWEKVDGETHKRQCKRDVCTQPEETAKHQWDSGKVTKPATCVEAGEMTFTCQDCLDAKVQPIPVSDSHDYTDHYESDGTETHKAYCACGAVRTENHAFTQEGKVIEKPTSTKEGKQEKLCICGEKKIVSIPKTSAEYDKVPKTGDITGQVVAMSALAVLAAVAVLALVFKRKPRVK